MNIVTRRALPTVLALFLFASCSDDGAENSASSNSTNASNNANASTNNQSNNANDVGNTNNVGVDAGMDAGEACPDAPTCEGDLRLVECECVDMMDRSCDDDSDCRADEECRTVDDVKVCWWEAPEAKVCPGAEGCDGSGDDVIYVGAASKIVTPLGFETPKPAGLDDGNSITFEAGAANDENWNDCGYDGLCPGDEGYTAPDEGEGDGIAQGMWIAGFSNGRAAQYCPAEKIGCSEPDCCVSKYAHDDLKVQVAVFRRNDTTVAFASLDVIGLFHTDIETMKARLADDVDVDLLIMAATHNHEAPDFEGQWGPGEPFPRVTGVDPTFRERVYAQTVAGIEDAIAALEPADIQATVVDAGLDGLAMNDSRTPYIFDDNLPIVRATSKANGETIATLFSWSNHAEVLWSSNPYITADYFHFTRKYVEEGLAAVPGNGNQVLKPELPGVGGVTVMFAGAVGGLMYPGPGGAKNYADEAIPDERRHTYEAADAVGQRLASHVLAAIHGGDMTSLDGPDLRFATRRYLTDIDNKAYQVGAFALKIFSRDVYNAATIGAAKFAPGNPYVQTQVSMVRMGPVTFFTAPGEMFPEMLTGGFPGKPRVQTPVVGDHEERRVAATCDEDGLPTANDDGGLPCIVKKDAENPPDWTQTPDGPYGYEIVPGEIPFFIGLGHDHLGYMVPPWDWETTYLSAAPGDHYEETNSAGPRLYTDWRRELEAIIGLLP